jgi:hypothetical protein
VYKDEKQWDTWQRSTMAQARAQDVHEILDTWSSGKRRKNVFLTFLRVQKYGARRLVRAVGRVDIQTQNFACW